MRSNGDALGAALLATFCAAVTVFAHGAEPQAQSVVSAGDAGFIVGTTFGAVVTSDDGQSFRWVCEEAVGLSQNERASWFVSPAGTWFAGAFSGLYVSRDRGCSFTPHASFAATGVTAVTGQGGTVYVASGRYGVINGVWRSTDDGVTFLPTPARDAATFFSSVVLAPSRPQRLYAGAWYFEPPASKLFVSDDGAVSFTAIDLTAALPAPGPFTVLAVHPTKPDVLLAALSSNATPVHHWLVRSVDAGQSFEVVAELPEPATGAAFSDDGAKAWVAAGATLYESTDEGVTIAALPSPTRQACIAASAGRRWVCGAMDADGFAVASGPHAGPLTPWLTWEKIIGVADCPVNSPVRTTCEPFYPVLRAELGLPPLEPAASEPAKPGGCGCGNTGPSGGPGLLVSYFVAFGWRRRVGGPS
jgi:hypothetical protein